jgi:hypothetical protein
MSNDKENKATVTFYTDNSMGEGIGCCFEKTFHLNSDARRFMSDTDPIEHPLNDGTILVIPRHLIVKYIFQPKKQ